MFLSLSWLYLTTCLLTTVTCQETSPARCMFQETLYGRFIHPCRNFEGESCKYSCYSNFNPPNVISTSTVTCSSSGSWTGNLDCPDPVEAAASTVDPNEPVIIQQPIYPQPSSGGVTSPPEFRTCPEIQDFENGIAQGFCRRATKGSTCSFRCNEGFRLKGVKKLKCNGEAWNEELPVCQEIGPGSEECRPLLSTRNGSLTGDCKIPFLGSVCSLTCDPGFRPLGASKFTCTGKGWTNENPRCVNMTCKTITSPENGYRVGDCDPGVVGNFCAFACKKGYALVGPSVLYCNYKGVWDPAEQATCIIYPLACSSDPPSTTTIEPSSLSPPQPTTQTSSTEQSAATTETPTTVPQTTPQTPTETTPIVVSQSSSSVQPESLTQAPPVVTSQPTSMQSETQTPATIISQKSEQPEVLTQTPSIIVSQTTPEQSSTQATPMSQMTSSEEPEYLTQTVADSVTNHPHTEADTSQWEIISDVTTQIYPTGHPIRETKRRGRIQTTENNIRRIQ